jgi:glyoxylase-like metal-dependent hydrolase (beta-lactamase superfamily II)
MANTYLVDEERLFVIDPDSEKNVRLLLSYVQHVLHRPIHDIDLIVLTRFHPDRRAAAETLHDFCHAPIAAPAGTQQFLAQQRRRQSKSSLNYITERFLPTSLAHIDPLQTRQTNQITLWLHDLEGLPSHPDWRIITIPSYIPECLCLYNPFTRELLCGESIMTIRGRATFARGNTNRAQLAETVRTLRSLPISYLYPGCGRALLSHHTLTNLDIEE